MISELPELKIEKSEIDFLIESFLTEYKLTKVPIEVSFRALIPQLKRTDRLTHLIHTYPAKLLMHIPYFFLNNNVFSKRGDTILDPFCGTGTVLLEAILAVDTLLVQIQTR
jgi:DNA modification methylase